MLSDNIKIKIMLYDNMFSDNMLSDNMLIRANKIMLSKNIMLYEIFTHSFHGPSVLTK
jgi:hypothetical protein